MNRDFFSVLLIISLLHLPASLWAESSAPEISLDGMELVEKDRRGEIYADPGIDWSVYTEIKLDPATVAFRRNWQRDQNRYQSFKVRDSDMQRIKSDLAELFDEVFREELTTNGGYQMTDTSGEHVMRIEPHIVDLDVYAPDTRSPGISRSYTETSGKMTLKLHIYDSITGDLLVAASDRRETPRRGYMQWTNSVTNKTDARRMLQHWAEGLRQRLDEARGQQ